MTFSIRTIGEVVQLSVTENNVICTLKLGKSHDIFTKGEDINGLAERIAYSYRTLNGAGDIGKDFLKSIRSDLIKRSDSNKTPDPES